MHLKQISCRPGYTSVTVCCCISLLIVTKRGHPKIWMPTSPETDRGITCVTKRTAIGQAIAMQHSEVCVCVRGDSQAHSSLSPWLKQHLLIHWRHCLLGARACAQRTGMDVYDSVGGALYALDNAPYRGALRLFAGRSCMYTTYRYGCV